MNLRKDHYRPLDNPCPMSQPCIFGCLCRTNTHAQHRRPGAQRELTRPHSVPYASDQGTYLAVHQTRSTWGLACGGPQLEARLTVQGTMSRALARRRAVARSAPKAGGQLAVAPPPTETCRRGLLPPDARPAAVAPPRPAAVASPHEHAQSAHPSKQPPLRVKQVSVRTSRRRLSPARRRRRLRRLPWRAVPPLVLPPIGGASKK